MAAVLCAKYGVSSLPQVWFVKEAKDDGTHPNLGILLELSAVIRGEEVARAELASTATCSYCGAEPGRLCVRKRGKYAGQPLGGFAERMSSPFRSASFHGRRLAAAIETGVAALDDARLLAASNRNGTVRPNYIG